MFYTGILMALNRPDILEPTRVTTPTLAIARHDTHRTALLIPALTHDRDRGPRGRRVGMEVTFVAWLKEPGDDVIEGEPLFQLDTQKTLLDVEAVGSGRLTSIAASPGDLVEPHQVIARLLGVGEVESAVSAATALDGSDAPGAVAAATEEAAAGTAVMTPTGRGGVSPRARRLAEELGIDLGGISGTGGDGLITEAT
jgi:pyruvate/2-oxoglutarate dehydrogenase complex dihydrolipoamide acyltransferase (E2) component